MARHYIYLVWVTMFLNIILNIPNILIEDRFSGALMSIFLSIPIGTLFAFLFSKGMGRFHKKDISRIFEETLPSFIRIPYLVFLGLMWALAGSFAIVSYSYIIKLYLNPDMNMKIIVIFLVIIVMYGGALRSTSILYLVEIIMIVATPLVGFILFKTLTSKYLYPVHFLRILHFSWQMPSYSSLSAATYTFIGYINLAVFNRYIDTKKAMKFFWLVPVSGTAVLFSSFFIPICFFGIQGVGDTLFPWILTADSLRMSYGFIERTIFILLLLYIQLTILFGIVTWHIAQKIILSTFPKGRVFKSGKVQNIFLFIVLAMFGVMTYMIQEMTNQRELFSIVKLWLNIRLPAEAILVVLIFLLSLRRKVHE